MNHPITTYRGPRPPVAGTRNWGRRAHQLARDPHMHRLAPGLWCRADAPLDRLQRAVLLQRHITAPHCCVRLTGITALRLLGIPVGQNYPWANRALGHPVPPRAAELDHHLHRLLHLSWLGTRRRMKDPDIILSKSYGLGSFEGPWESVLVHPVEALVVAAPMMSRWAVTACLDALFVARNLSCVLPPPSSVAQPTSLTPADVHAALDSLPPTSRAVQAVRRALSETQFPTLSPMETLARLLAMACGLPRPVMNFRVDTPLGYSLLDLAWPGSKTAVEFNGRVHSDHEAYKDEMYRNEVLRDLGWKLRIIVFDDLRDRRRLLEWLTWLGGQLGVFPRFPRSA